MAPTAQPSDMSVVIPHYGSYALLEKCLDSLLTTPVGTVIVVEDGCHDPDIRSQYPTVVFESLKANSGFAAACNHGLKRVETPFVALLNNDVQVTPDWHLPILKVMEQHPEVAACQPKVKSARNPREFDYAGAAGGFLDKYGYPFCRGRIFDALEEDVGQYDTPCELFWASGAAFVARTEDVRQAKGFDPTFFAYMEEIDLCWRLQTLGRRVVFVPQSEVYHEGSVSWSQMPGRKAFLLHRNSLLLLIKNSAGRDFRAILWKRVLMEVASAIFFFMRRDILRAAIVLRALSWNLGHFAEHRGKSRGRTGGRNHSLRAQSPRGVYPGSIALRHFVGGISRFSDLRWTAQGSQLDHHKPDKDFSGR